MAKELTAKEIERKRKKAERNREYRKNNKDKFEAWFKAYREKNKDKEKERHRKYYQENKEKIHARRKALHWDKILVKSREYYHKNKNRIIEYRKKNKSKLSVTHFKGWLKRKYGITLDDYNKMLSEQNYGCIICGDAQHGKRLSVDHCHGTGKIRGLLCDRHNMALGMFGDNIEHLQKAIHYIKKHREVDLLEKAYRLKIGEPVIVPQGGVAMQSPIR